MNPKKRILIAPLDWGLGHATRCVPIIRDQLKEGHDVILGVYGSSGEWLKREFPKLHTVSLPGMKVRYPKNGNMKWAMFLQSAGFISAIRKENKLLRKVIRTENIDHVISDNRYGLYSDLVPSTIITHQLFIKAGIFSGTVRLLNHFYLKKFNDVWVPDLPEAPGLAGELSHGKHQLKNVKYIGPLSRFDSSAEKTNLPDIEYLLVLSGPEPQRSILENELANRFRNETSSITIVRGTGNRSCPDFPPQTTIIDSAGTNELASILLRSKNIICRPGYSTIMDLYALKLTGSSIEFIPTPGQTEQEYLAQLHGKKFTGFSSQ